MKKYFAEAIGTMVLVLLGCGSAVFNGGVGTTAQVLTVSFAFGLSVVAMAYAIGSISGCHINPAITLGAMLTGRMKTGEGLKYMLAQVIGAFVGSALIFALVRTGDKDAALYATTTGANAVSNAASVGSALIAEIVGTFIFVLVVLGVTDSKKGNPAFAGLAIGLTLVLIHIVLIPITGTSVNPARSIAPAVFEGGQALKDLWIFIVGPFVGAALSAVVWDGLAKEPAKK
ncbi:MAG TPA: MIP family channel protein [Bacteroidales bacterium]|jgi:aquaporin Z|nr:MIP family channel protein [Bacteroidales bacterium]HKM12275.1 MIP family channel protein [Bacteroidales bacterium]HPB88569.1 MIP family channel protein [Bacteroidales bacterium]HPY21207.1 MIP family channel protein [Bacteroidales bacterium]HQA92595.1 MIP family channel protein [Bacteroidales bacterium]